jgi:hypothetical protein
MNFPTKASASSKILRSGHREQHDEEFHQRLDLCHPDVAKRLGNEGAHRDRDERRPKVLRPSTQTA